MRISPYASLAGFAPASGDGYRWQDDAACRDVPVDVFFPPPMGPASYDAAKVICTSCPVRRDCLAFAVCNGILPDVRGGVRREVADVALLRRLPQPVAVDAREEVVVTPVEQAEARGHAMRDALPYGADQRWTCERCFAAVIRHGTAVYGLAIERDCNWVSAA